MRNRTEKTSAITKPGKVNRFIFFELISNDVQFSAQEMNCVLD